MTPELPVNALRFTAGLKVSEIFRGYKENARYLYRFHPQWDIIEAGFDVAIRCAEALEKGGMDAEIENAGERLKQLLPILVAQEEEFEVEAE